MKFGEMCRTKQGAPARYIGNGKALYVSAMDNDLVVSDAINRSGGEENFPLPSLKDCRKYLIKEIK